MAAQRHCILVLGMHRSGTSALTRVINLLGADLPNTLMPGKEDNTEGFWESSVLIDLNDALLADLGSTWDDWSALDLEALSSEQRASWIRRLSDAIDAEFGDAPVFVLKDPRVSRFAPLYFEMLQSKEIAVHPVHMTRNPLEVASSLGRRDGFSAEFSHLLWLRHSLDAERATRRMNRIFVTYDGLLAGDSCASQRLAEWGEALGFSSDAKAVALAGQDINAGLRHSREGEESLENAEDALSGMLLKTLKALQVLEHDPERPEALAIMDSVYASLNLCSELFARNRKDLWRDDGRASPGLDDPTTKMLFGEMTNLHKGVANLQESVNLLHGEIAGTYKKLADAEARLAETQAALSVEQRARRLAVHAHDEAQSEVKALRGQITKLLRSPLVSLGDNLRYRAAKRISKLVARTSPETSARFARSAAKRDPKRFMAAPDMAPVERAVDVSVPEIATGTGGSHAVVLPFPARLLSKRAPQRIAVVLHVYYVDQAEFFRDALRALPEAFSLFISTDSEEKAKTLREVFAKGPAAHTDIRVLPNRGRDIAPKLVGFADIYQDQDLVLFLHTKVSEHDSSRLRNWRNYLIEAMLGSRDTVESILDLFAAAPDLGIVAPPNFPVAREYMNWGVNYDACRALAERMGITISVDSPVDFPAGSMFWARPAAIQAFLDADVQLEDFPHEDGQTDATLAHAVERLFFYACEKAGLRWVHAGTEKQLDHLDQPLRITSARNLEWVMSDQMPALMLPGIRPSPKPFRSPEARLSIAKEEFRDRCKQDLAAFLESGERLVFDDPGEAPKLSIVLILYNQAELTFHCLRSLKREAGAGVQIIILDNGSRDDTDALLDQIDGAVLLRNEENLHFLRGVNRAAQKATGEYFLLLNNDVRVLSGTIPAAINRLAGDKTIGAVGGPIMLLDGSLQEAGSIVFSNGACLGYGRGRDPGEAEFRFRRDVDYCSGAFLMMRRAVWEELNGFDEAFAPAYYEETDLCMRIWKKGLRVVYDPDVKIVHFEFGSSTVSESALALQKKNSKTFLKKHAKALAELHQPIGTPPIRARQRNDASPRLLVIDDRVPYPHLGAGYPRAAHMLNEIGAAGWSATLFPISFPYFSCEKAYEVIPDTTELTLGEPVQDLAKFLRERRGCFDAILVSRPHNMIRFRAAVETIPNWEDLPVLYDAEAIFAERDAALAKIGGRKNFDATKALEKELDLTKGTRTVFSVSPGETEIFRNHGHRDVRVLGHALAPRPLGRGPEGRRNMLFVGALDDDISPNMDSVDWFVRSVMPRIDAEIGTDWQLDLVGRAGAKGLRALESDRVNVLGRVENLDRYYENARLFVAPTRYAAGIPMKVHEAASVGVPCVTTDLLAWQLGWQDQDIVLHADGAEAFAAQCVRLYRGDALWTRLRENALAAVARDCDPAPFAATLRAALKDALGLVRRI